MNESIVVRLCWLVFFLLLLPLLPFFCLLSNLQFVFTKKIIVDQLAMFLLLMMKNLIKNLARLFTKA